MLMLKSILIISSSSRRSLMVQSKSKAIYADVKEHPQKLFLVQVPDGLTAGDVRVTIQPTLASIQTLFLK